MTAALDEALDEAGRPRPAYRRVLAALEETGPNAAAKRVATWLEEEGVWFASGETEEAQAFRVDPVPRLISAGEWAKLERGLAQRAQALNAFISDMYGERRMVLEGRIPESVVCDADHFEAGLEVGDLPMVPAPVIGFDLVRGADHP